MCRHICPIGNATGLERNTARARALGLSLVNRGVYDLSEVAENLYECACCGACTKECATGFDPVAFVKDARLDAALSGKLPPYILKAVQNCLETGNAYGVTETDPALKEAIARHAEKKNVLLFLGVDARCRVPESAVNAIRVLEKAGVYFTVLADEPASGWQLAYLIGHAAETENAMKNCASVLAGYDTVIAYDPQDASVFCREYAEWGITAKRAVTFTSYLAKLVSDGKLTGEKKIKAVYQDPFQLSRDLGETEEPRKVISRFADLSEMLCFGKHTMWAGNLLMAEWMPDVMRRVAADRLTNVKGVKADTVVTASVSEYASIKAVATDVRVISIEELILM